MDVAKKKKKWKQGKVHSYKKIKIKNVGMGLVFKETGWKRTWLRSLMHEIQEQGMKTRYKQKPDLTDLLSILK